MANYRYPQQIEFMDKLPKTPAGKFLRRELRVEARAKV
jgi:acyl-coenzyme A synthetase/AMP-(fatty) acid ligase